MIGFSMQETDVRRVGVVGAGLIGMRRAHAFEGLGCEIVAICDVDENRASRAQEFAGAKFTNDHDELLSLVGAEGIAVVATVHKDLPLIAAQALKAGLHVLIEKPGAARFEDLAPVKQLASESALTVRVGFNHRFHPAIQMLRTAIAQESLGSPTTIRAVYGHGGRKGYETEWRFDRSISGGGELLDQGSHLIDLSRFLLGDQLNLYYAHLDTKFWEAEVEDNAFLHLRGSTSGADAWLHASWTEWKNRFEFEVFCRQGKFRVMGLGGSYGPERFERYEMKGGYGPPEITSTEFAPGDESWTKECAAFLDEINSGTSDIATVDDALDVLRLVGEAYKR
jgi:predicted dehydrogenase